MILGQGREERIFETNDHGFINQLHHCYTTLNIGLCDFAHLKVGGGFVIFLVWK